MTSHIKRLVEHGLINPPRWLPSNVMFEAMTGSYAYGCNEEGSSDIDLIGFAIPPKFVLFPHLTGHIHGFGAAPDNFEQYQPASHSRQRNAKGIRFDCLQHRQILRALSPEQPQHDRCIVCSQAMRAAFDGNLRACARAQEDVLEHECRQQISRVCLFAS